MAPPIYCRRALFYRGLPFGARPKVWPANWPPSPCNPGGVVSAPPTTTCMQAPVALLPCTACPSLPHLQRLPVQVLCQVVTAVAKVEQIRCIVHILLPQVEGPHMLRGEAHRLAGSCRLEVLAARMQTHQVTCSVQGHIESTHTHTANTQHADVLLRCVQGLDRPLHETDN